MKLQVVVLILLFLAWATLKIDLEVDGRRWHTDIDGNRKVSDIWRDHQLKSMGWKVIRFWVDELDKDMERCIGLIEQELT